MTIGEDFIGPYVFVFTLYHAPAKILHLSAFTESLVRHCQVFSYRTFIATPVLLFENVNPKL